MSAVPHQSVQFGCPHCGCRLTLPANAGPIEGPCPRCSQPIRAGDARTQQQQAAPTPAQNPVAAPAQNPVAAPAPKPVAATGSKPIASTPALHHKTPMLHCQCPSCGHRQSFTAQQFGQVAACGGCHTAIRLPQMPQPEVPMPQKATVPPQSTAAPFKPSPHPAAPAPATALSYEAVVKQLHDYEEAGVPSNHPDRLHALEQFFKTVSAAGGAPSPPTPSAPMASGNSLPAKPTQSHIPPRRDQAEANDRTSFLPPVRTTPPPPLSHPPSGAQAMPFRPAETAAPFRKAEPAEPFRPDRTPKNNRVDSLIDKKKAPPMEDARLLKRRRSTAPPFSNPDSSFGARRKITRVEKLTLLSALIIATLVVAYFARGLYQSKHQQAAQIEPASLARENTPAPPPLTMAEQNEIKDIVYAFHEASTPEAKATFVADGFQMLERMTNFYAANGVEPAEITIDPYLILVEQGAVDYFRGTGRYPDGRTIEFYAKRQGNEFVLDWPSVSGYSTMSWPTFLAEKPALPMEFRVVANKVDRGSSASQELALALSAPRMPEKVICYADAASLAGSELDQVFKEFGASPVKLTLKLAYAGAPGNDPRLVVTELVRKDWLAHTESL